MALPGMELALTHTAQTHTHAVHVPHTDMFNAEFLSGSPSTFNQELANHVSPPLPPTSVLLIEVDPASF